MVKQILHQSRLQGSPKENTWILAADQSICTIATPSLTKNIEQRCTEILQRRIAIRFTAHTVEKKSESKPPEPISTEKPENDFKDTLRDPRMVKFAQDLQAAPIKKSIKSIV